MYYRRSKIANATYFFTVNLAERKRKLLVEHIEVLRQAFGKVKQQHPFDIEAVVVLPDHLHALMKFPLDDSNYPLRWNLIKGYFSRALAQEEKISVSRRKKRERGIWQRRYWEHQIRDERDYEAHFNYIHFNPVKHGYVNKAGDWPYTSLHRYIALGVLPANWANVAKEINGEFGE